TLKPDGLGLLRLEPQVVALERRRRLTAELALLLGVAEAGAAPAGVEQPQQLRERAIRSLPVEPLQHLMDEDPEALVDGWLLGDPEDPRELVLQRARPVRVDIGGRKHHAVSALGQEWLERRLVASCDRLTATPSVPLGVEQIVVERGGGEDLALLG